MAKRLLETPQDFRRPLWPAPYDQDTAEAAWQFVLAQHTWNEAEQDEQPFPDEEYLRLYAQEWWECKKAGRVLVTEKCRRMVVSWLARSLELWAMGLKRTDCILVGEDLEAASKHVWRLQFLYEGMKRRNPSWKLPECHTLSYEGEKRLKAFFLPNGSSTNYANGQAKNLQGDGTAIITSEEFGQYRYAAGMLAQAKIVTKGKAGSVGGFVNLITNTNANYEWQQVKKGAELIGEPINGFEVYDLPTGARYLKIRHYADPKKDGQWLKAVQTEMADTPDDFRREILMDETVYGGHPVYPIYNDERHCPEKFRYQAIPRVNQSLYFGGWDCGGTLNPAFVLIQVTQRPFQAHVLLEVVSEGGESMEQFAPRVLSAIMQRLPGEWDEVQHFGDQTVITRNGANGTTAQQEAAKHGLSIAPVGNTWAPRLAAVTWLLKRDIDEKTPGFLIDGMGCPVLRAGFQGAYKYRAAVGGDSAGPGAIILEPVKNSYSHVHDALQYPAIKIREFVEGGGARML